MFATTRKLHHLLSRREQWQAVLLLGIMICGALLEMVGVGAIPAFVTLLSDPSRVEKYAIARNILDRLPPHTDSQLALGGAVVLLVIFLIKNSYLAAVSVLQARYVTNRQINIAARVFRTYLESPYWVHLQRNSAELLRNATNESMDVVGAVLMPMLSLTMEALTVSAILILLLLAEPFISLVAL
ncbi:MAG TPA: hypothetical protein VJU82_04795, partial [Acidobacteriaceae bacterium]|nr:hypothetical protein [Acidobacteriaceae bacterium]